jgi:hypothetical protein
MMKGKREELQTCGSLIGRRLSQFLHMSGTETVVMTVESMMVGLTVDVRLRNIKVKRSTVYT